VIRHEHVLAPAFNHPPAPPLHMGCIRDPRSNYFFFWWFLEARKWGWHPERVQKSREDSTEFLVRYRSLRVLPVNGSVYYRTWNKRWLRFSRTYLPR